MAQAARSMIPHPPGVRDGDSGWARIREQNARYWPRFSDSEYQRRYREIRKLMAAQGIDCLIMMSSGYLSSANLIYVAPGVASRRASTRPLARGARPFLRMPPCLRERR